MRVVAGSLRSRRLVAPDGRATRPTSDRLRESLFAALGPIADARCLDLFAGSGALGIEALSRGAGSCVFVEIDSRALAALRENLATLELGERATVIARDARRVLRADAAGGRSYDLILVDPPYGMLPDLQPMLERHLATVAAPGARLVVEAPTRSEPSYPGFERDSLRRVGAASLSQFTLQESR